MTRKLLTFLLLVVSTSAFAQDQNTAIDEYNKFKNQARQKYDDFRRKCNEQYAAFLKEAWQSYQQWAPVPVPKEEEVPPVVLPKEDEDKPIETRPLPIDTVVPPIIVEPEPQPMPVAPVYEKPVVQENRLDFVFFGTEEKVRIPKEKSQAALLLNQTLNEDNLAKAWMELSNGELDNTLRDCLEIRIRYSLSDWAYLEMLRQLSDTYYDGPTNAATLLLSWLYCQTGYQMRLASEKSKLFLLIASKHTIFNQAYFKMDGIMFYPFTREGESTDNDLLISNASFPEEKPLSLYVPDAQEFSVELADDRKISSQRYPDVVASVQVNKNLLDFYATYPTSMLGENVCSRWAMYANTPLADNLREQFYPQLKEKLAGKSELDAVNILLNWVQTGFQYEYDDKVWGHDRAFFAEESLYYPYCDCEDRSILFTKLVRDLLGMDCILVFYPGHLASAVHFSEEVAGDYVLLNNEKFVIADPTYINAPVGLTMPGMDNQSAQVILLQKK